MSHQVKASSFQEQDQHHTLSNGSSPGLRGVSKDYKTERRQDSQGSKCDGFRTLGLLMFLFVCVCVMTVRYIQMNGKEPKFDVNIQQIQTLSQQIQSDFTSSHLHNQVSQQQSTTTLPQQPSIDQNLDSRNPEKNSQNQKNPEKNEKLPVSQDIIREDPKHGLVDYFNLPDDHARDVINAENSEPESTGESHNERIDESSNEELNRNGAKSVEEAELLNNKGKNIPQNSGNFVDQEYGLHPRADSKKEKSVQSENLQENQVQKNEKKDGTNDEQGENLNKESKVKASVQISQQDLFDPIIRVKDQMQETFNQKFEDLIYIKEGTNITKQQYQKAKERMNIWKYFNPKTGNLQLLEEVSYDLEVTATQKATQQVLQKVKHIIKEQQDQFENKYQVSQYQEIPFCIIIPSYKNQDKYFRNLNSILQQDYQKYHIIYIDDASKDGTAQKVLEYIKKYNISENRLKFIENQENAKALPNIDMAARRLCKSGEIMAIIDGDDYLIGTQVFKVINARYQKESLLALYTNHLRVHEPIYLKVGTCIDYPERVKKSRSFRRFSVFPASHLRTFYVDLYWRINIRDLKDYNGHYFEAANDFAIMMPILQMAGERFEYLPELTYIYDAGTGFNNFQTKAETQAKNFKITKRRHRYPKLVRSFKLPGSYMQKKEMTFEIQNMLQKDQRSPGRKLRDLIRK